jgi:hypothetical protein
MHLLYLASGLRKSDDTTGSNVTFAAAREAQNVQDMREIIYVDAGAWAGGEDGKAKTSFLLVCDRDVVLCTWLNLCESTPPPANDYRYNFPLSPESTNYSITHTLHTKTQQFLRKANQIRRARPMAIAVASEPLTDQLLVVVGDLHLNAYLMQWPDRFQYTAPGTTQRISLDLELRSLLHIAKDCGAQTIQVGDMYDVWMTEMLLRMQYLELEKWLIKHPDERRTDLESLCASCRMIPRMNWLSVPPEAWVQFSALVGIKLVDPLSLFGLNIGYEYLVAKGALNSYVPDFGPILSSDYIETHAVNFLDYGALTRAIQQRHCGLWGVTTSQMTRLQHGGLPPLFDIEVDGNHDNQKSNMWWTKYAPAEFRNHPLLKQPTTAGKPRKLNTMIGSSIYIEHGHIYDWDNNDEDWWIDQRGFGITFVGYASSHLSRIAMRTGYQDKALAGADWWSDFRDYEMRLYGLRRADELFSNDRNLRLVILGHTHEPALIASSASCRLGPKYPGYASYETGNHYWRRKM